MSFANNLKTIRKNAGLTQEQLADQLNISAQAVSRWEKGTAMPDISQLPVLANLFHVTIDSMLDVDIEHKEEKIQEIIDKVLDLDDGETYLDRIEKYKKYVQLYPGDVRVKEALIQLYRAEAIRTNTQEVGLVRDLFELNEQILEQGGGRFGENFYRNQAIILAQKLGNLERATDLIEQNSCRLSESYEVQRPMGLKGREKIEALKNLLFKCADKADNAIYDLYAEADNLTEAELLSLENARNIIKTIYGEDFSDFYVRQSNRVQAVIAWSKRDNIGKTIEHLEELTCSLEKTCTLSQFEDHPLLDDEGRLVLFYDKSLFSTEKQEAEQIYELLSSSLSAYHLNDSRLKNLLDRIKKIDNKDSVIDDRRNSLLRFMSKGSE